jgi:2-haloacid dehalogenase
MPKPEAVVFDIGNVLISWQPERFYDQAIGISARKRMFTTVDLHAMNDRIDRGGDFRDTVYQTAERHPEFSDAIRQWHDNWLDIATPEITHSVALSRALRAKGIATYILSNIGRETYDLAAGKFPFLAEFDRHYLSGPMQVLKPEPEIYQQVEADCGLPPGKLLFVDDRLENIKAAIARGWLGHHFTSPESWAETLVEMALLTRQEAGLVPA